MSFSLYERILRPALFALDPETAHHFALFCLRFPGLRFPCAPSDPQKARLVFGLKFPNAAGLAAGFDKNAVALPAWEALGFGFVEAGTITSLGQPGNPKPRIFRIPEKEALINRLGFNNDGAERVAERLRALKASGRWPRIPVGLNIGKAKVTPVEEAPADYLFSFEKLFPYADYFVLNVSSPNTPGLRALQHAKPLDELLDAVQSNNFARPSPKPVLVKIAPDLDFPQIEGILDVALRRRVAGIVATNTTVDQSAIDESQRREGGLSGAPLRAKSTAIVKFIASKVSLPIIAVGGISDADSAREKLDAGASLLQIYTGFIYRGPALIREIREM